MGSYHEGQRAYFTEGRGGGGYEYHLSEVPVEGGVECSGISHWYEGQLEREVENGFWILCDTKEDVINFQGGDAWGALLRGAGCGAFAEVPEGARVREEIEFDGGDYDGEDDVDLPSDAHVFGS